MSSSTTHATEYAQAMTSLAQGLSFGVAGQFGQQWWEAFKPIFVRKLDDYSGAIVLTSPDRNFGSRRRSTNSRKVEPYESRTYWYRNFKQICRVTSKRSRALPRERIGSAFRGPIEMRKLIAKRVAFRTIPQLFLFGRKLIKRSRRRRKNRKRMSLVPSNAITRARRLSLNEDDQGDPNKNRRGVEARLTGRRRQSLRRRRERPRRGNRSSCRTTRLNIRSGPSL